MFIKEAMHLTNHAGYRYGKLTGLLALLVLVAASLWPTQAKACSCAPYVRYSIYPPQDSTAISPKTHISFVVGGYSGYRVEHQNIGRYRLHQEGVHTGQSNMIALRVKQQGSFVQLTPTRPLAPGMWYRLAYLATSIKESDGYTHKMPGTTVTRFKTAKTGAIALATPKNLPRILKIEQVPSRANTTFCSGRSAVASFFLQDPGIPTEQQGLFFWALQTRDKGGQWHTYQGMPLASYDVYRKQWTHDLRLDVGHGQCSQSPVFSRQTYTIRAVLIRSDGKQWATTPQELKFRY